MKFLSQQPGFDLRHRRTMAQIIANLVYLMEYEAYRLFALKRLVPVRSSLAHCSEGLDLRPAITTCCRSCFRQRLLAVFSGDCLLSSGCRTDRCREKYIKRRKQNKQRQCTALSPIQVQGPWRQSKWNQEDSLWKKRFVKQMLTSMSTCLLSSNNSQAFF